MEYRTEMAHFIDYVVSCCPQDDLNVLLSQKSKHWSYESEWRLIVELNETIGTGLRDSRGQSINLIRVPNQAVVKVFCTERTPIDVAKKVRARLENTNNRYSTQRLTKLITSRGCRQINLVQITIARIWQIAR